MILKQKALIHKELTPSFSEMDSEFLSQFVSAVCSEEG
jgi:hypothetical protein